MFPKMMFALQGRRFLDIKAIQKNTMMAALKAVPQDSRGSIVGLNA
jgi:hypothetical protein